MADGHHHLLVGNHVLDAEVGAAVFNRGTALVSEALLDVQQFGFDDFHPTLHAVQDVLQIRDDRHQLVVLGAELVALQARQLLESHVQDGTGLNFTEFKLLHQAIARLLRRFAGTNQRDDRVDVVEGNDQALQNVGPFFRLAQIKLRATDHHIVPVLDVVRHHLLQVEQLRTAFHQGDVVDRERGLKLRVLVQLIEHHIGDGVALQFVHDAHAVPVRLVPDLGDALDFFVVDQIRGLADHVGFVHLVGNLLHDDHLAPCLGLLKARTSAHHHAAPARLECVAHALNAVDHTPGGEIRCLHVLHEVLHGAIGVVHQVHHAVHHFAEVVGRHVRGHPHRDACGAVDEQVRNLGRQHRRFLQALVEVGAEVDRLLVQVGQHLLGRLSKACLGVTHGCRVVSVDGPEVPLPVHHGVAQGPVLGHADHGVVHRAVAVRVVLSEHLPHNPCRLLVRSVGQHAQVEHAIKHPSVHGLEAVAHVGERPTHNHRHRVVDVGRLHLVRDVDLNDFFSFSHGFQFVPPRPAWPPCFST